ncbi:heat shock protein Hsp20 [Pseudarthrobacter chlorophenolicus A6]|uniref:Heat shock protein Hsp20 n=1 Tax=Pseudarthrobacter chlorophenolicus (strain ATCC 700700 / DSM 12829 / CIP 107037 / JCM 12360 / KCTC 9906 / NCIMB 13794 / A6) TaxID=452863 RepID=B8H6W2_PSECP|nr:Hsp20/alpha crystallin family protein [Pseudarthrobacter chlorophenolicus]ACL39683.1 heat shock protein Hsp20 [Pseudarthrobacter chlorophenolicus A6]SDQ95427.1 HSP20 family protein [Pseudarthrobacter chlorophenolicus]
MSDLLRWSPSATSRRTPPFTTILRSPLELLDSMERLFATDSGPAPIRVEEFVDGKNLVIRAEMPGVDPDNDIEVTMEDGALKIHAERQEKEEHKDNGRYRSEFHYGSFSRSIPLPEGVKEEDVKASYTNGVLEVRAPMPDVTERAAPRKLPITRG